MFCVYDDEEGVRRMKKKRVAYQAEQEGINFSQVLQEALKEKLGIEKE